MTYFLVSCRLQSLGLKQSLLHPSSRFTEHRPLDDMLQLVLLPLVHACAVQFGRFSVCTSAEADGV